MAPTADRRSNEVFWTTPIRVKVVCIGIGLLCVIALFPPWRFTHSVHSGGGTVQKPGPYASIFAPPEVPLTSTERISGTTYESFGDYLRSGWSVSIDVVRWVLPACAVVLITAALFFTLKQ